MWYRSVSSCTSSRSRTSNPTKYVAQEVPGSHRPDAAIGCFVFLFAVVGPVWKGYSQGKSSEGKAAEPDGVSASDGEAEPGSVIASDQEAAPGTCAPFNDVTDYS